MLAVDKRHAFRWCGAESENGADVIVFGVNDESGSRATRKGSSGGPDAARASSVKFDAVKRGKKESIMYSGLKSSRVNAYDSGNIAKSKVESFARKHAARKTVLGCIGGDHSITYEILKGIDKTVDSWGCVYIDAHPDMISSAGKYYGSVAYDMLSLKNVEPKSCVIVGARAIEGEEAEKIQELGIKVIGMERIIEDGIVAVSKYIKNLMPTEAYVSIDLDSVDPAFAPGVSTPVPGGLEAREILYIASTIGKSVSLGFDVMELNPRYDSGGMTARLADLLMMNMAASARKR